MSNVIESLAYLKGRLKDSEGGFLTDVEVDRAHLRTVAESLEKLVKEVTFKEGDIVREVGQEETTGEIIQVKEGKYGISYLVKLNEPYLGFKSITYYENEIELIERKK